MRPVRPYGDGMELESEARGVELRVEVAGVLRPLHRPSDGPDPFVHDRRNAVPHDSKAAIELERSGGEETSAFEDPFFDEHEPMINQSPKAGHALGSSDGRERHFLDKNLARHLDGG